jgi:putative ABC transport system ATP-binding protein
MRLEKEPKLMAIPMVEVQALADADLYALRDVVKEYGSGETLVTAVGGIDLRVGRGEFVVVAGPSGSGKTTLLQLLGALDRPTRGRVLFEGRDLNRMADRELALLRRNRIGFIFQQFNLIPTLNAAQNVEVAMAPLGLKASGRQERAEELLKRVGLGHRLGNLPSQLSGGEQQRVAIARALANGPDVLLADEPTGNIDTRTGQQIVALLSELNDQEGLTVVLITHDPSIAQSVERVVRLQDGRLLAPEDAGGMEAAGGSGAS